MSAADGRERRVVIGRVRELAEEHPNAVESGSID
jgi:hypothetical protein